MTTMPESMDTVRVPRVLTPEMLEAVVHLDMTATHDPLWPEYWNALLSAAPTPPAVSGVREALVEDLEAYDAVVRACPANKRNLGEKPCPKCKALSNEGCREENRAAYAFISNTRAALASLAPESGSAGK